MKVTVSAPKKSEVTIRVEVDDSELKKHEAKAIAQLGKEVKISGFRPGKIPADILEKNIGPGVIRSYTIENALPHFYADAVIKEKVQVVARPQIKVVTESPFVFEAVVAVLPVVEISGYDKIKVKKEKVEVKDKDIDDLLNYFRKEHATNTIVDRPAKMGDRVEVDFAGFDPEGDVPLEGTASKNHPAILGEKTLIPGFEEELVGLKAEDEKTFEITFPKDYDIKKFQGKKVKFKVKVHLVQEVQLPEITKEWTKTMFGKEMDLEELKKMARENITKERERHEKERQENEFLDELLKLAKLDVPDTLIEEEIDFIIDRLKMDLESRGLSWEQYEKYLESQKRDVRKDKRVAAEKQVRLRLVVHHLYKAEKIEATEAEVAARVEEMALAYPKEQQAKVKENCKKGNPGYVQVENILLLEKLLKKFNS
ncbi:MAG: trigger factor [Candidatus Gracilibacteria bacterium]